MSKIKFELNYKDACILKHALRDQIIFKESCIDEYYDTLELYKNMNDKEFDNLPYDGVEVDKQLEEKGLTIEKDKKELKEEKRCLEKFTEQLNNWKKNKGIDSKGTKEDFNKRILW